MLNLARRGLALAAFLALAACGTLPGTIDNGDPRDEIAAVADFALEDLRAAKAAAEAQDDEAAALCWGALADYVETVPAKISGPTIGAATVYQRARHARRVYDRGPPERVHIACAAMLDDARSTLLRLSKLLRIASPL